MIQAGIIGASGYTGQELLRILASHESVEITVATSRSLAGSAVSSTYGNLRDAVDLDFEDIPIADAASRCDVLFIALPHGIASQRITKDILDDTVIIDLGADYRLTDVGIYEQWYACTHGSPDLLAQAVYGLSELHHKKIAQASIIANPGCYTTSAILSAAPLLEKGLIDPASLIIDAKSGVSGAGRTAKTALMFCECDENLKAYGIASHRHTPEIEQELSALAKEQITLTFTPHLVPMNRGILTTCYAARSGEASLDEVLEIYGEFYKDAPWVRVLPKGSFPETRWVKGSNFCDIGVTLDTRTNRMIAVGAIDNLMKGAAGQAVQNMNIRFGLEQTAGLGLGSIFPG